MLEVLKGTDAASISIFNDDGTLKIAIRDIEASNPTSNRAGGGRQPDRFAIFH